MLDVIAHSPNNLLMAAEQYNKALYQQKEEKGAVRGSAAGHEKSKDGI